MISIWKMNFYFIAPLHCNWIDCFITIQTIPTAIHERFKNLTKNLENSCCFTDLSFNPSMIQSINSTYEFIDIHNISIRWIFFVNLFIIFE